ncbi:MAG: rod shape-determining protein MreD [Acidimicrobiales bacterium]
MGADPVTFGSLVRSTLVVILVLVIQSTLGLDLHFWGAHPELIWLLPVASGLVAGPARGAFIGFGAGLAADLLLPTPFGLSALIGSILGFSTGFIMARTEGSPWWVSMPIAAAGSAGAVMAYAVIGAVLGQEQFIDVSLVPIVVVVAVVNALFAPVAVRLMTWALPSPELRRPALSTGGNRW